MQGFPSDWKSVECHLKEGTCPVAHSSSLVPLDIYICNLSFIDTCIHSLTNVG